MSEVVGRVSSCENCGTTWEDCGPRCCTYCDHPEVEGWTTSSTEGINMTVNNDGYSSLCAGPEWDQEREALREFHDARTERSHDRPLNMRGRCDRCFEMKWLPVIRPHPDPDKIGWALCTECAS